MLKVSNSSKALFRYRRSKHDSSCIMNWLVCVAFWRCRRPTTCSSSIVTTQTLSSLSLCTTLIQDPQPFQGAQENEMAAMQAVHQHSVQEPEFTASAGLAVQTTPACSVSTTLHQLSCNDRNLHKPKLRLLPWFLKTRRPAYQSHRSSVSGCTSDLCSHHMSVQGAVRVVDP